METRDLLSKIALIDNQRFSLKFLWYVSSNSKILNDDIYQMLKVGIIDEKTLYRGEQIFELHDVMKTAILKHNGQAKNKIHIEEIIKNIEHHFQHNSRDNFYYQT